MASDWQQLRSKRDSGSLHIVEVRDLRWKKYKKNEASRGKLWHMLPGPTWWQYVTIWCYGNPKGKFHDAWREATSGLVEQDLMASQPAHRHRAGSVFRLGGGRANWKVARLPDLKILKTQPANHAIKTQPRDVVVQGLAPAPRPKFWWSQRSPSVIGPLTPEVIPCDWLWHVSSLGSSRFVPNITFDFLRILPAAPWNNVSSSGAVTASPRGAHGWSPCAGKVARSTGRASRWVSPLKMMVQFLW